VTRLKATHSTIAIGISALLLSACSAVSSLSPTVVLQSTSNARIYPGDGAKGQSSNSTTVSGTVLELGTGVPIAGAIVTVGSLPDVNTCVGYEGCGHPVGTLHTAKSNSHGIFTIKGASIGEVFLQISKSGFAVLHARIALHDTANQLGSKRIAALRPDEIQAIDLLNHYRTTVSKPRTLGNLVVDEYALEYIRKFEDEIQEGKLSYGDPVYSAPADGNFGFETGGIEAGSQNSPKGEMEGYFGEKQFCPNGNWKTCPYSETTGHYIQGSDSNDVWATPGRTSKPTRPGHGRIVPLFDFGFVVIHGFRPK